MVDKRANRKKELNIHDLHPWVQIALDLILNFISDKIIISINENEISEDGSYVIIFSEKPLTENARMITRWAFSEKTRMTSCVTINLNGASPPLATPLVKCESDIIIGITKMINSVYENC